MDSKLMSMRAFILAALLQLAMLILAGCKDSSSEVTVEELAPNRYVRSALLLAKEDPFIAGTPQYPSDWPSELSAGPGWLVSGGSLWEDQDDNHQLRLIRMEAITHEKPEEVLERFDQSLRNSGYESNGGHTMQQMTGLQEQFAVYRGPEGSGVLSVSIFVIYGRALDDWRFVSIKVLREQS